MDLELSTIFKTHVVFFFSSLQAENCHNPKCFSHLVVHNPLRIWYRLWRQTLWLNMVAGRDRDWHCFQKKMTKRKESQGKRRKQRGNVQQHYLTTQSQFKGLAQKVTGKLRDKYSRIGACLFVSYEFEEDTIENIKSACMKHFGIPEDGILCCNMLVGEQGPSYRGSYRGGVTKANPKPNAQAPLQVQA